MWRYNKIRAIFLTGVVFALVVWTIPVRSQEQEQAKDANAEKSEKVEQVKPEKPEKPPDPKAATTIKDLSIPPDELKLLAKPLTLEELRDESAAWMLALQAKAKEISEVEVTIKRQN